MLNALDPPRLSTSVSVMKSIRPSAIIVLGPLLLGIAIAVGALLAMPRSHELPGFGWLFAIGVAAGLAMFGPIAAILAIGERHPEWLGRHSWRIGFYCSMAMGLSMGYLAACVYHSVSDNFMLAALALVFLGAVVKTALSYALRQQHRDSVR